MERDHRMARLQGILFQAKRLESLSLIETRAIVARGSKLLEAARRSHGLTDSTARARPRGAGETRPTHLPFG